MVFRQLALASLAGAGMFLLGTGAAQGASVYMIDFGKGTNVNPANWNLINNNLVTMGTVYTSPTLVTNTGASSAITLSIDSINHPFEVNGGLTVTDVNNNGAPATGVAASLGFARFATDDNFYGSSTGAPNVGTPTTLYSTPQITFANLDPSGSTQYTFYIYASRSAQWVNGAGPTGSPLTDNRTTLYTAVGLNTISGTLAVTENTANVATLANIVPDVTGKVVLSIAKDPSNTTAFSYIGAMRIDAVPEPGTAGVLATGALALASRRRRRV